MKKSLIILVFISLFSFALAENEEETATLLTSSESGVIETSTGNEENNSGNTEESNSGSTQENNEISSGNIEENSEETQTGTEENNSLSIFDENFDISSINLEEDDVEIQIEIANYLASLGILVDHSDEPSGYNLENNILRQEIAGTIAIIVGLENSGVCKNSFADVAITEENSWACPRIESLLENGIIAANPNYRPMDYVSKIEAIGFVLNSLFLEEYENSKNPDLIWEENAIKFANEKQIIFGDVLNRENPASRGFVFTVLYLALERFEEEGKDLNDILKDRAEFVKKMREKENTENNSGSEENNEISSGNIEENSENNSGATEETSSGSEENNSENTTTEENIEEAMLKALNDFRKENNLAEVKLNETLSKAALNHAKDMVANNYVSHYSKDGKNPADRITALGYKFSNVGENLAKTNKYNIDLAMQLWIESQKHKENMLGQFSEVGFAYVDGIFVQVFATPY